jgi:hypothetical protein
MSAGRLIAQVFAGSGAISFWLWSLPCVWWTWPLFSYPPCSHMSYTFAILSHSIFNIASVVPLHLCAGVMLVVRQGQINPDFLAGGWAFSMERLGVRAGAAAIKSGWGLGGVNNLSFCGRFCLCSGGAMVKLQLRLAITVNLRAIERHFAGHGKHMHQLRVFHSSQQ